MYRSILRYTFSIQLNIAVDSSHVVDSDLPAIPSQNHLTWRQPPPPFVVVQGQYIMTDWLAPEVDRDIHIETSEKGFTIDEIAVKWLYHFIKHSDAGPTSV